MANSLTAEVLWQFSLTLYPKVKTSCLQWQDELGANINLVLLLCYLEQQQLSLTSGQLQQLAATLMQFSTQFTQPLRQLRKSATHNNFAPTLQQQLKHSLLQAELELERLEQQLLLTHCPAPTSKATPLLELYLAQLKAEPNAVASQLVDLRQSWHQLT